VTITIGYPKIHNGLLTCNNGLHRVFVYGSLMKGLALHGLLTGSTYKGKGWVSGFKMYDLGVYPGITIGYGIVLGEIYDITYEQMERLDQAEGCDIARPEHSLYVRHRIIVNTPGDKTEGWVYIYQGELNEDDTVIENGDWHSVFNTKKKLW
jgi:gamma-glutamylcyclotransferase (GGCT)/AIG2-like uncharacterized protein YtfP